MERDPFFERKRCPHPMIEHCPLYIAGHDGVISNLGCVDDIAEPCLVERGQDYAALLGKVQAADPRMVAQAKWAEDVAEFQAQRARNLRAAGIH